MPAPLKIMVIAPDELTANHVAKRCGINDRNDWVWIRDHRMLNAGHMARPQIIEAYSKRSWVKLENDKRWNEVYQQIRERAAKMVSDGKIDTYALVYCE